MARSMESRSTSINEGGYVYDDERDRPDFAGFTASELLKLESEYGYDFSAHPAHPAMKKMLIIENIEDVTGNGTTRGWIVPAGTDADADLELEAVGVVDIPADEDPDQWRRNLTAALGADGWELDGELHRDGPTITAPVKRTGNPPWRTS